MSARSTSSSSSCTLSSSQPYKDLLRWIKPNVRITELLEEEWKAYKEKKLQSSSTTATTAGSVNGNNNNRNSSSNRTAQNLPSFVFVGILKNSSQVEFRKSLFKLSRNMYQNIKLDELDQNNQRLKGIRISNELFPLSLDDKKILITAYFIQESYIKNSLQLNIRINKKKRSRNKKKENVINPITIDQNTQNSNHENNMSEMINIANGDQEENVENRENSSMEGVETTNGDQEVVSSVGMETDYDNDNFQPPNDWKSYQDRVQLSSKFVYINGQRTKFPESHILKKLHKESIDSSEKPASTLLLEHIMKQPLKNGEQRNNNNSDEITTKIIQHFCTQKKLDNLLQILDSIILFHRKFKKYDEGFHTLVKSCLQYWEKKLKENEMKKVNCGTENGNENPDEIETNRKRKGPNRIQNKSKKPKMGNEHDSNRDEAESNEIEMIDLTGNTSSTNLSSIPNISGEISNISISNNNINNTSIVENTMNFTSSHEKSSSKSASSSVPHDNSNNNTLNESKSPISKTTTYKILQKTVPHKVIISALSQILFLSGTEKLLGSKYNMKRFRKFIKNSVFLGGLNSKFYLKHLMSFLNPDKCDWLDGINNYKIRAHLFAKVALWIFNEFIIAILRTCFYVTDRSKGRNTLIFYLREDWTSFSLKFYHDWAHKYEKLKVVDKNDDDVSGRLRLLPKSDLTVRPIFIRIMKEENFWSKFERDKTNKNNIRLLLRHMSSEIAPHASLGDSMTFHFQWTEFLKKWKSEGYKELYFLKVDIQNAYGSVNLEQLKRILDEWEGGSNLILNKYNYSTKGAAGKSVRSKSYEFLQRSSESETTPMFIKCRPWNEFKLEKKSNFDANKALNCVREILNQNVIKVGKKFYELHNGLPQGWPISPFLCNIYYGSMDREYFWDFFGDQISQAGHVEFFAKTVDDYLFISNNESRIIDIFNRIRARSAEQTTKYNFKINHKKSIHNIKRKKNDPNSSLSFIQETSDSKVVFCGWKLCTKTGHVMRDLSTYKGIDAANLLSFKMNQNQDNESFIQKRLSYIGCLRLNPKMFDIRINCRHRIVKTTLEASLMMAFRFYGMCRVLYPNLDAVLMSETSVKLNKFFFAICDCVKRLTSLIISFRTHSEYLSGKQNGSTPPPGHLHNCGFDTIGPCTTPIVPDQKNGSKSQITRQSQELYKGEDLAADELRFIIYSGFCLKLGKHPSAGKLTKLVKRCRDKRRRILEQENGLKFYDLTKVVRDSLPESFALMKI